jgi:hypothetical protein
MTAVAPQSVVPRPFPPVHRPRGSRFLGYLSTTDPKRLGVMYIVTSFRVLLRDRCVQERLPVGVPSPDGPVQGRVVEVLLTRAAG